MSIWSQSSVMILKIENCLYSYSFCIHFLFMVTGWVPLPSVFHFIFQKTNLLHGPCWYDDLVNNLRLKKPHFHHGNLPTKMNRRYFSILILDFWNYFLFFPNVAHFKAPKRRSRKAARKGRKARKSTKKRRSKRKAAKKAKKSTKKKVRF